ncbi:MAG: DNA translocase FtsK 4TM domain-containing protein [Ignavibacteriae bacterium]|nr:DNA translocase FtsK 4TM domain-containing protein [Ignavibacteriota bacterium]
MADVTKQLPYVKTNRERQVYAFAGLLLAFMVLLSLISYTSGDQTDGDIAVWKIFTNDPEALAKAERTSNWLGIVGAIISNWLINSTIGYAIVMLPVLSMVWLWAFARGKNLQKLLVPTIYTTVFTLLFASINGTIRLVGDTQLLPVEWSGLVGEFLAGILSKLIGLTGTVLLLVGAMITTAVFAFDIDMLKLLERAKAWLGEVLDWLDEKRIAAEQEREMKRATQVEIKKAEVELPPAQRIEMRKPPVESKPPVTKEEVEEEEPVSDSQETEDLDLNIKEMHREEEVNFDEREQDVDKEEEIDYVPPSVDLLDHARTSEEVDEMELKTNAELLRAKLSDFGVEIESVSVTPGPVVTLYELVPATGVKISKIESLEDDIALALKAKGIRIIAPIPGKGTVGVEIPNHNPALVTIRSTINSTKFRESTAALPLAMGKTISGEVFIDDLSKMPHLLIAGATGSGKSVGINTILTSLIYRLHPSDVKFVVIDPKKIELSLFSKLRRHFLAVSPDIDEEIITTPNNAVLMLKSVEYEMEKRYDLLAAAGVRNIADYNERLKSGRLHDTESVKHRKLPYLIVVIDELADLMITAAREVEEPIARLAQLARAVGIHLVLATQRPSVDVITGVIKANFPARIAYQVASKIDSRTILDMNGAEQLLGNGDMLYLPPGTPKPIRIQNAFITTDEVERVTNHIAKQQGYSQPMHLPSVFEKKKMASITGGDDRDELFEEAARIIVRHQQGSVSLLQRRLKIGYSRAARLVDELEAAGVVGQFDGSKAREVLIDSEAGLEAVLKGIKA